jgi:signal transduction histidine kinase
MVEDEGMGIAPENLERIFHKFERAVSSKNISGFGLGLFVSRYIVEAHQGTIRVESEIGKGSRFIVTLPKVRTI